MTDRVRALVFIFAKAPALRHGKSRLAVGLGPVEALRINRWLHAKTIAAASDPRWTSTLMVAPDHAVARHADQSWRAVRQRKAQGPGDLGARLSRCAANVDRANPRATLAIIGADCPALTRALIARAIQRARRDGVHIIPAVDGGFVLIAARSARLLKGVFAPVHWSSARTLSDVCANLRAKGQRFSLATALADIDTPADWLAAARTRASCGV